MYASYKKYTLKFNRPAGTSRGTLTEKESWFIFLHDEPNQPAKAVGECGILKGLSCDDRPEYEEKLKEICENINEPREALEKKTVDYPSIRFGLEQAFNNYKYENKSLYLPSTFTEGEKSIKINGLIWMGKKEFMLEQIKQKLKNSFTCIKIKIGAIDFDSELECIKYIRSQYGPEDIEIRTDANGAFAVNEAPFKLEQLAKYKIHSIEQPIKSGQIDEMAELCKKNIIPIALDEELIGIHDIESKMQLLSDIKPQYIILKPSLVGGYTACDEWINAAKQNHAGFWITSALESNVGLNAIAQYTAIKGDCEFPQGLGTGGLYTNNLPGPCFIENGRLLFNSSKVTQPVSL